MGIPVLHDGIRDIDAIPTRPKRPQFQIRILAVKKKIVIEAADFFEHSSPVQRGGPAGKQRLTGFSIPVRQLTVTALRAAGISANQHTGRIQQIGRLQPHVRCDHTRAGSLLGSAHQRLYPIGRRNRVIVEDEDVSGLRSFDALIHSRTKSYIRSVLDDMRRTALRK